LALQTQHLNTVEPLLPGWLGTKRVPET